MKIGIDARVAEWNIDSGVCNYTNKIIEHFRYIDQANKYLLFFPRKNIKDMYRSLVDEEVEVKNSYWKLVNHIPWYDQPQVDVFHNTMNGIGIPKSGIHKLVITVHDLIPYIMPETAEKHYLEYALKYTPEAIEKADKIITNSYHSKKDIKRYFQVPDHKVKVIHLAVDKIFKPMNKRLASDYIAAKYNIHDKFILYSGGFSPCKNIARLIRAYKMICNEFHNPIKLIILGEPSRTYESLIKLSEKLSLEEEVLFIGFVPPEDLPYFYNSCVTFVYPSLYEGFGSQLLEASSCGTPVVTSNVSSIPEIMGDSCTYVDPYSIVEIAQGVYDTIKDKDLRRSLSDKALDRSKRFSWLKTSAETLEVYRNVIE